MNNDNGFNSIEDEQLKILIEKYPAQLKQHNINVDIFGILLDYIGRTNKKIEDIFSSYPNLYNEIFKNDEEVLYKTKQLLKVILFNLEKRKSARAACKSKGWTIFEKLIDDIEDEIVEMDFLRTSSPADILVGHRVEGVVWQLSDIHFGKCNELGLEPKGLADIFSLIVRDTPELEPSLIVISGDVSSTASKDEFDAFIEFIDCLSEGVWHELRPHRILVIPGNHETTWLPGGKADKLNNFVKYFANTEKAVTPFWNGSKSGGDGDGEISIHPYFSKDEPDIPPFTIIYDKNLNLQILLLVSSYFSGDVPEAVRETLEKIEECSAKETLRNLLREDKGEITRENLIFLKKKLEKSDRRTSIAVIHHHLNQYGTKACEAPYTRDLLSTLAEKGFRLLLHGHTHLVEGFGSPRTPNPNEAYPIPCPTLCSDCEPGSTWGFMVHFFGPPAETRTLTTAVWNVDEYKFFKLNNSSLNVRYKFKISADSIEVLE